jgi:hypothetical protein
MAEWCEVKAYGMGNGLSAPAPSPFLPRPGPMPHEEGFTRSGLEASTVGLVLREMVRHPVRHLIRGWTGNPRQADC